MNYVQWLKNEGVSFDPSSLTESMALKLAEPVKDPGTPLIPVHRLVVHHSATESGNAACFRVLHRGVNRWNDIGYHFVIGNGTMSEDGAVERGRDVPFQGAHARGANEDSLGICLVGNFNSVKPSRAQMDSLGRLLRRLLKEYSLPLSSVTLHRLVKGSSTECPGHFITLPGIREIIES